jgi:hypothetical protein
VGFEPTGALSSASGFQDTLGMAQWSRFNLLCASLCASRPLEVGIDERDLQLEDEDGVVHLFAIQAAPNTKNAGSRRSDIASLKRAARPLRANRQRVSMNIAILAGQAKTRELPSEPGVTVLASDEFWHRITGIPDFRARLLRASTILSWLVKSRSADEVARIKEEARSLFGDPDGRLDLEAVATLGAEREQPALDEGLLDI